MRSVQDYILEAKKKAHIPSNNRLAQEIKIAGPSLVNISKGKGLPAEETLLKIADLAGISREEALLDLSIWRAKSPEAKSTWENIKKLLNTAAMAGSMLYITASNAAENNDFITIAKITGDAIKCLLC